MRFFIVSLIICTLATIGKAQLPDSSQTANGSSKHFFEIAKADSATQPLEQEADSLPKTDTIVKLGGGIIAANIVKDNLSKFYYSFPGDSKLIEIERGDINKIIYKSGKVVILNLKQANAIDVPGWRDVRVAYKPDEVEGMEVVADVESYCAGEAGVYQTAKWLERKATIDLQKKTVLLHGDCLLIVDKVVRRSYGDPTTVRLLGRIYRKK